jgi:hypothetical protein
VLDKPVAADMDQDGIDDIGLWVPRTSAHNPYAAAEWFFALSNDPLSVNRITGSVNTLNHPFEPPPFGSDIFAEFGHELALPLVGNFDPPVAPQSAQPATSLDGDFTGDSIVDGADFLSWQRNVSSRSASQNASQLADWEGNFGAVSSAATQGSSGVEGDFTDDSRVDGADFLAWQRNVSSQTSSQNADDLADWQANFGAVAAAAVSGSLAASETVVIAAPTAEEPAAAAVDAPAMSFAALQGEGLESPAPPLAPTRVADVNLDFVMLVGRPAARIWQKADAPVRDSAPLHSRDAVLSNWQRRSLDRVENAGASYFDDDWKIAVRGGKADAERVTPEELEELVFAEL